MMLRSSRFLATLTLLTSLTGCHFFFYDPYYDPNDPWWNEEPESCELLPVESEVDGLLEPTADVRIECGEHGQILTTSVVPSPTGVFVLADGSTSWTSHYRLQRLNGLGSATPSVVIPPWPGDGICWGDLEVDDDGDVMLFGQTNSPELWRAWLTSAEPVPHMLGAGNSTVDRVEVVGWQPHLWFNDQELSLDADGDWSLQPQQHIEGAQVFAIGLDGDGRELSYGWPLSGGATLSTFDGQNTKSWDLGAWVATPVPTAHPTDPTHEHALAVNNLTNIALLWPERDGEPMLIPVSPSYDNDADEPCLYANDLVAARTSDGRIWLAWLTDVVTFACAQDAAAMTERGQLRLVEIDPQRRTAREVMRIAVDTHNMASESILFGGEIIDGVSSISAYDQQLAIAIVDGPANARVRVITVDTAALPPDTGSHPPITDYPADDVTL